MSTTTPVLESLVGALASGAVHVVDLTQPLHEHTPVLKLPELETLARLRLPMLVVIYNDAAYGAEVHHFRPHGHPVELVRFPDTDFAALASAAGARGVTVRGPDDLAPVEAWLESRDGPLIVDAKITPDFCAEWLEEAFK